jgi:PAS domain S-box-containing protein
VARRLSAAAASLAIAVGAVYFAAWSTGAAADWVAAGRTVVKANMALCQILAGSSLLLLIAAERSRAARAAAVVLASLVFVIGGFTVAEFVLRRDLGIDQLLVAVRAAATTPTTTIRVGPFGSLSLMLLGAGLVGLARRRARLAQGLAILAGVMVMIPTVGILYGIDVIRDIVMTTRVAWLTVGGVLALATGILLARPDAGMMVLLTADDPGGRLLRRQLLPTLLVPLAAGWLRTLGIRRGLFDGPTGTGLLIATLVLFVVAMLWRAARQVSEWAGRQRESSRAERESRRAWQQLAEAMPQFVWTCTSTGDCDYISPQWFAYTGGPPGPEHLRRWLGRIHPDDVEKVMATWRAAVAADREFAAELRIRRQDGQWRWFIARALPVRTEDHVTVKWYGSTTDVDDLKAAQAAMRETARRFELLAGTAAELLLTREPQVAVAIMCRRVLEHLRCDICFNYLLEPAEGRLHLNAHAGIGDDEARRLEWLDPGDAVCGCVALDGQRIVAEDVDDSLDPRVALIRSYGIRAYACHPLLAPGGETIGTLSFGARDRRAFSTADLALMHAVTDQVAAAVLRMRSEQAVRQSARLFRDIADTAPAMLWITDPEGTCTYLSRAWHEFTGLPAAGDLDIDRLNAVHPADRDHARASFVEAGRRREPFTLEYRLRRADGDALWVLDTGRPRWSAEGGFLGFVGSVIDIDARRRVEDEIRHLNSTLERRVAERTVELRQLTLELAQAEQRERNRLAELLHDGLQQLLVAAKLHVGLVVRADDDQQRSDRAEQLNELLQDALAGTRTLTVELSPPALRDQGLVPALRWLAEWMQTKHHLDVAILVDGPAEPQDATLRTLLYQCVRELLLNVVKYAEVGAAEIRLGLDDDGMLSVEVNDGGLGFDPAVVVAANSRSFGLASIHRRVELVGGRVRVRSAPGQGTQIRLEVPVGEAEAVG